MASNLSIDNLLHELGKLSPAGYFVGLHIRFAAPLLMFQTYDQAWIDHYTNNAYAMRDPMIAWGFSKSGASRWSEITLPDPFGILKEARQFGLIYGCCVGCGEMSSRTIAGAARSDREYTDDEMARIGAIILRLHQKTQPPESLTSAQIEALRLIGAGDRHAAAAAKLGISESALKARLNSARERLFARTTAEAIQRARDFRLL